MKFTLTYDGELPSTGNGSTKIERKWRIRRSFHPQLVELWSVQPALRALRTSPTYPKGGALGVQVHHTAPGEPNLRPMTPSIAPLHGASGGPHKGEQIELMGLVTVGEKNFLPLVRSSLALTCSLDILFMRRDAPGKVYQGGDLDNRLKTLFDALSLPRDKNHVIRDDAAEDPILCLLEDDSLITGLSVRTERLLDAPTTNESYVRLIIDVSVTVTDARIYNYSFLGD